jgi:hypothetical protein
MATKKKAPKKKAAKKAAAKKDNGTSVASEFTREDLLTMQIAVKDIEIANLRKELAALRAEVTANGLTQAQATLQQLSGQVNEKYALTPGEDSYDLSTGVITRGAQE